MRSPSCPLCEAHVDDDDDLRRHLAVVHQLEDDPGTTTYLGALDVVLAVDDRTWAETHGSRPVAEPSLRIYDPEAEDDRWRPIVLGFGGVLLLALVALALSFGA